MLRIIHSNRMEHLRDLLAEQLRIPAPDWFTPETVIVQSQGIKRWLDMSLARAVGISANIDYLYPGRFVWNAYRTVHPHLPDTSPFDSAILVWRILGLFEQLDPDDLRLKELHGYLARADHYERFELAWRIADVFDQYLVYRPDWIDDWEKNTHQHWQAVLWRELAKDPTPHRARLHQQLAAALPTLTQRPATLPERISIVGIGTLPHAYVDVFALLGQLCEVHLYLLNPCREYWGLINTEREIARRNSEDEAEALYLETGNRLLASLGRQGRDFHHLLADANNVEQYEQFQDIEEDNLLHCLQADILNLQNRGLNAIRGNHDSLTCTIDRTALTDTDNSVQIHVCHSAMREVEVLYDQLVRLFEQNPDLKAADVVVMTPDIDTYAPCIRAVFATQEPRIPFGIADRALRAESPVTDAFFALLELVGGRFDVNRVSALLDMPPVYSRFALGEADRELINDWLRATAVRWGIDEQSRAGLGLPAVAEHTWKAGLERLLLGFALPAADRRLYGHILPFDAVEGDGARVLGRFSRFTRLLFTLDRRLSEARTIADWQRELYGIMDDFISADDAFEIERSRLRDAIADLGEQAVQAAFNDPVPLDIPRAWLRKQLGASGGMDGFLSGGVTFCAMVPMRSIPFQVVCLIGLNDGAYPRPHRPADFDLMAEKPRRGDRSRRLDDRYLFLEALLSTRHTLYISYIGRSVRDNNPIPPSVLISELLDYIRQGFDNTEHIVVEHPLQPFSRRYFENDRHLISYSKTLCDAASRAGRGNSDGLPLFPAPLPEPEAAYRTLSIDQLIHFLHNPTRYLLRERLKLRLLESEGLLETREPFELEDFKDSAIRRKLLDSWLDGLKPAEVLPLVRAGGWLPHDQIGTALFAREAARIKPLLARLDDTRRDIGRRPEINVALGDFRLTGWLSNVSDTGLLSYSVDHLSARHYLDLWVRHLVLHLADSIREPRSVWLGLSGNLAFRPVDNAGQHLQDLLALYWQGLRTPLKFFPKSALEYIKARDNPKADPLSKARSCWDGWQDKVGESQQLYFQFAFRHSEPIDAEFADLAERVFAPLWDHKDGD